MAKLWVQYTVVRTRVYQKQNAAELVRAKLVHLRSFPLTSCRRRSLPPTMRNKPRRLRGVIPLLAFSSTCVLSNFAHL